MGIFDFFKKKKKAIPSPKVIRLGNLDSRAVKPDNTPLYLKRGWTKDNNSYEGYFRTQFGAWKGSIEKRGDKFNVYIFEPPIKELKKHSRWPCFHKQKGNKWKIKLSKNPVDGDVGSIIFHIERIIIESYQAPEKIVETPSFNFPNLNIPPASELIKPNYFPGLNLTSSFSQTSKSLEDLLRYGKLKF